LRSLGLGNRVLVFARPAADDFRSHVIERVWIVLNELRALVRRRPRIVEIRKADVIVNLGRAAVRGAYR
jgi:hypothetical protein